MKRAPCPRRLVLVLTLGCAAIQGCATGGEVSTGRTDSGSAAMDAATGNNDGGAPPDTSMARDASMPDA